MKYICNICLHVFLPETAFIRGCTQIQGGIEYGSDMKVRCGLGKIIQIEQVSLWRTNSAANCQHINLRDLYRYSCEMLSGAVQQKCHQRNNCQYTLTYPDRNDCPEQDYLPDRPIVLRIDFECIPSKYLFLTTRSRLARRLPSNPEYKPHLNRQYNCWPLRCSWSISCRSCSNYIVILAFTPDSIRLH